MSTIFCDVPRCRQVSDIRTPDGERCWNHWVQRCKEQERRSKATILAAWADDPVYTYHLVTTLEDFG